MKYIGFDDNTAKHHEIRLVPIDKIDILRAFSTKKDNHTISIKTTAGNEVIQHYRRYEDMLEAFESFRKILEG